MMHPRLFWLLTYLFIMVQKKPAAAKQPGSSEAVVKKPAASGAIDWSSWAEKEEKEEEKEEGSQHDSSSHKSSDSESEPASQKKRKTAAVWEAGKDAHGQDLPIDNSDSCTPSQKYVFDRLAERQPELKQQFKSGNRDSRRQLVNSIIPPEAGYNVRMDPDTVQCVLTRLVTSKQFKSSKGIQEGKTLTEMEATWGEKYVELGLKRGDIRINEAGLYVVRREIATDGQVTINSRSLEVQGKVDGNNQEALFDKISPWAAGRRSSSNELQEDRITVQSSKRSSKKGAAVHRPTRSSTTRPWPTCRMPTTCATFRFGRPRAWQRA